MRYLPHTEAEIAEMLEVVGKASLDELFDPIPAEAQFDGDLLVPPALAEPQLMRHLVDLARRNTGTEMVSFLGAGAYAHHIPPAVDQLLLRSEFYTAYTPYQPEVAQGTLQAIFEFQTIVSELFGLPLSNASMYDGATACAEAVQMARRLSRRDRILLSRCVHPDYRAVIKTYLSGRDDSSLVEFDVAQAGTADTDALVAALNDETACVVVGHPSFFGGVIDLRPLADAAHGRGALLVTATSEPYALALVESPGAMGVDIAAGEGQGLACPPNFGGPGVGLFACRDERKYLQQLPGRLCGQTVDSNGQVGYVLTLSTREQHIRRERATSNICTNQGLVALSLAIRVSMLGRRGFEETAQHCMAKARYLESQLTALPGYTRAFAAPHYFNELAFTVRGGDAARACRIAEERNILAGLDLGRVDSAHGDKLLIALTERHTQAEIDALVAALDAV
jgi:glycine dehydrogenase subunit 1